ncbi:hypothetical protein BDV93DRAFT_513353 [Ceratobasidium sp. AG-I]|nr:hypothetical protein BDV93DRAFT_513353 [Ceratobasidium sp. AG-I]
MVVCERESRSREGPWLEKEVIIAARLMIRKVEFREQYLRMLEAWVIWAQMGGAAKPRKSCSNKAQTPPILSSGQQSLNGGKAPILACLDCLNMAIRSWHQVDWYNAPAPVGHVDYLLLCIPSDECWDLFRPGYIIETWNQGCEGCMWQIKSIVGREGIRGIARINISKNPLRSGAWVLLRISQEQKEHHIWGSGALWSTLEPCIDVSRWLLRTQFQIHFKWVPDCPPSLRDPEIMN